MTRRIFTQYTLLCGVLFLTSCKKEKQQEDNNTDLLTRSSWVVTKEEYDNGGGTWETFSENEMLYKKLTFNFKANGTIIIENKTSGGTWNGEWSFTDNGTKIWTKDKLLPEWKIVRLTKTELQIIQPAGHAGEPDERCTLVHP